MYTCKECGLEVIVLPSGEIIRACNHTAPVIADMEATCEGKGGLKI